MEETMKKPTIALTILALAALIAACSSTQQGTSTGKVIKSAPAGNGLTVSLSTADGVLKHGNSLFTLSFTDSSGTPVDVGAVALTFHMPQMGTMAEMTQLRSRLQRRRAFTAEKRKFKSQASGRQRSPTTDRRDVARRHFR
jgi:predicted small secreted protein